MPLEISATTASEAAIRDRGPARIRSWGRRQVKASERMFFTEQLALLLETGISLYGALQALQGQTDNPTLAAVIGRLLDDISGGKPFSQALEQHPSVFSTTYVKLVAASEGGGFMHEVLSQLHQAEEKREQLRTTIISALSYPGFLVVFSIMMVVFVLVAVFPKFAVMFARIHDQLPMTTIVLMSVSDFFRAYWIQCLAGLGLFIGVLNQWLHTAVGAAWLDRFKLRAPVIRDVFVQLYLIQTLRVMSLSLGRGVSILDTMEACKEVVNNIVFRQFLSGIERSVREGGTIAAGFRKSVFVPSIVQQMVATAEASGNLAKVMGRVADYYERELGKKLDLLSKIAEPVMLLVMGLVVGVLVSSLILPIFKLSRAVS